MRLREATLATLRPELARPAYSRSAQAVGIVHFGIGAFHRAHQAAFTDAAMNAGECDWAITGVSLRSAAVAQQLDPQDGLYTVVERSAAGMAAALIGAVRNVLVASAEPGAVVAAIAAASTQIASFTITEKGYCRQADGTLDEALAGPGSVFAYLALGLRARMVAGLGGLTLLSCDNLADNGAQLERLLNEYLERHDPALRGWFERECTCPLTMVDRIVPATTAADRAEVRDLLGGLDDRACVVTEPFSQWVIEDRFAGPRPGWDKVGAQLVGDVRSYETAKLRMLNGAHSALAYMGLAQGHEFVHQAIGDGAICPLIEALMRTEAAPTIAAAPEHDLGRYTAELLDRFANPALNHRLIQIAMDGSQKIPQRWLETLAANRAMGRDCPAILAGISAWFQHLRGQNGLVDDPRAAELGEALKTADPVWTIFGSDGLLASNWVPSEADHRAIHAQIA